jgi:hypothetical protein
MASRPIARRLVAFAAAAVLVITGATTALANVANPTGEIERTVQGNYLTIWGTWAWPDMKLPCTDRWVGWAIDWGEWTDDQVPVRIGNQVGTTDWFVGGPGDNAVYTNQDCGSSSLVTNSKGKYYPVGTWGPISHTYPSRPGEYKVCVLLYDIHLKPAPRGRGIGAPSGPSSPSPKSATELIAGGTTRNDHNRDNGAENGGLLPDIEGGPCTIISVGDE